MVVLAAVSICGSRTGLCTLLVYVLLIVGSFGIGDYNVYHMGNYNRYNNSSPPPKSFRWANLFNAFSDRHPKPPPIIVMSDYGTAYEDGEHPIYFMYSDVKNNHIGSLIMEQDNKLGKGITDLDEFARKNHEVWCIGSDEDQKMAPPARATNWKAVQTFKLKDPISRVTSYKATEHQTE